MLSNELKMFRKFDEMQGTHRGMRPRCGSLWMAHGEHQLAGGPGSEPQATGELNGGQHPRSRRF